MKKYQNVLETLCRQENADIIFSIRLPQSFPYFDEIIHLSDAEIQHIRENGGWSDLYFHGLIRIQVYVKDMNLSQTGNSFLVEDNAKYPCHDREMQAFGLSSDKAAYYLCKRGGCFTGLPAIKVDGTYSESDSVKNEVIVYVYLV